MKTTVLKWLLGIAALLFADWLIMIILGCFSGMCGAGTNYYCSVYCIIGVTLLAATVFLTGFLVIRSFLNGKLKGK